MAEAGPVEHPYNKKYDTLPGTKLLIVGTAPPPRFCKSPWSCEEDLDFNFFYGSGSNWMWAILPSALNKPNALPETLSADDCVKAAEEFLKSHDIWMRDVLGYIRRKDERSAKDSDLEILDENDLADFRGTLQSAPNLAAIATTSELAFVWLMMALNAQRIADVLGHEKLRVWRDFRSTRFNTGTTELD